jgi:hypothetical protein
MLAIQVYETRNKVYRYHYFSTRAEYKMNLPKMLKEPDLITSIRILYSGKIWMLLAFRDLMFKEKLLNCEQVELNGSSILGKNIKFEIPKSTNLQKLLPQLKILGISNLLWIDFNDIFSQLIEIKFNSIILKNFPDKININISKIMISECDLEYLKVLDLSLFLQLNEISIIKSNLKVCPIFPMNGVLTNIHLFGNNLTYLEKIPESVLNIYVHCNQISVLPDVPINIETLIISHNPLRRLPTNILLCRRIRNLFFYETEIELSVLEIRMIERLQNPIQIQNMYMDSQNVHNTFIQKSFINSCERLFNDSIPDYKFETTGNLKVDEIILKNMEIDERHVILNISFREIFQKVWNRIQNENKMESGNDELMERLKQELLDGEDKCFTGKITRLVNSLVSFFPDIQINIGTSDQIQAKIQQNMIRNNGILNQQELINELREIDVPEQTIKEWITAYEENEIQ